MFAVGDKVVCVDAVTPPKNTRFPPIATLLSRGRVYLVEGTHGSHNGSTILSLSEVDFYRFESWRFRKIQKADDQFTEQVRACRPKTKETAR